MLHVTLLDVMSLKLDNWARRIWKPNKVNGKKSFIRLVSSTVGFVVN